MKGQAKDHEYKTHGHGLWGGALTVGVVGDGLQVSNGKNVGLL